MSTTRALSRADLGPRKAGHCRWCDAQVVKPRISWCSDACVALYRFLSDPGAQRAAVEARDHGVCSASCGLDTESLRLGLQGAWAEFHHDSPARRYRQPNRTTYDHAEAQRVNTAAAFVEAQERRTIVENWNALAVACGLPAMRLHRTEPDGSLWQADHIVPVVEGGGLDRSMTREQVLAGLRTLCNGCHRRETAALAKRRAAARRSQLPLGGL